MSKKLLFLCLAMMPLASMAQQGLKDAIGKYCLIGAAINQWQSDGQVPEGDAIVDKHFNCAVAENCMKPESLAPAEGIFDFRVADKFVSYCQQTRRLPTGGLPTVIRPVLPPRKYSGSGSSSTSRPPLATSRVRYMAGMW